MEWKSEFEKKFHDLQGPYSNQIDLFDLGSTVVGWWYPYASKRVNSQYLLKLWLDLNCLYCALCCTTKYIGNI